MLSLGFWKAKKKKIKKKRQKATGGARILTCKKIPEKEQKQTCRYIPIIFFHQILCVSYAQHNSVHSGLDLADVVHTNTAPAIPKCKDWKHGNLVFHGYLSPSGDLE